MKYSIIIVAYKAEEYLRKCLKSIKESKIEDAEIILIDNSPEFLFGDSKPAAECRLPFRAFFPGGNLGFAAGCNLGAKYASGQILIFVNPDCEMYDTWADDMSDRLSDTVLAIGPIASGYASGYHSAKAHGIMGVGREAYDECLEKFKGETITGLKVLIGFFLMITKHIYDEVGGMDAGCFLGCDDLDLSLRLRYRYGECLAIARDVCVMHTGHKSFESRPSKEVEALIKQSEDHLRETLYLKYGGKPPSGKELWGLEYFNTERPRPMTLSVCMIVRDEDKNLRELIPQLEFADELVVVDTDPDMAEAKFGISEMVKAFSFPWTNNFSEARNFALSKCTSDWILWLDADDRIPENTGKLIRAAMDKPGWKTWNRRCAFEFVVVNTGPTPEQNTDFNQCRLFPNLPGVEWKNRVHENPLNSLDDLGIEYIATDITILHTGYSDPELLKSKQVRNIALLEMEESNVAKHFNLGNSYGAMDEWEKAEKEYRYALDTEWPAPLDVSFIDHLRYMVAISLTNQKKLLKAGSFIEGNKKPDCVHLLGEYHMENGDKDAAFIAFREYLRLTEKRRFEPWLSFRTMLRKQSYGRIATLLNDFVEETLEASEKEYPGAIKRL